MNLLCHGRARRWHDPGVDEFSFVALFAAGAFVLRMLWSRDQSAAIATWTRAARLLGGEHETSGGEHVIRVEVDGIPLVARTRSERIGRNASRSTIVVARLPGGERTMVEAVPRGATAWIAPALLATTLGRPERVTGDATFDAKFRVSSTPEALAGELLDGGLRRLLLDVGEGFLVDGGELRIEREGTPADVESLVRIVRFSERIVRAWNDVVRAPERVARALGWIVEDAMVLDADADALVARGVRRGVSCELVVRFREAWALVVVRIAARGASAGAMVRETEAPSGWAESGAVPDTLRALTQTAPRSLVGVQQTEDALELAFDGLGVDPTHVVASVDAALDGLVAQAPYR